MGDQDIDQTGCDANPPSQILTLILLVTERWARLEPQFQRFSLGPPSFAYDPLIHASGLNPVNAFKRISMSKVANPQKVAGRTDPLTETGVRTLVTGYLHIPLNGNRHRPNGHGLYRFDFSSSRPNPKGE